MDVDNHLKGLIAVRCLVDKSYTFKNGVWHITLDQVLSILPVLELLLFHQLRFRSNFEAGKMEQT